MIVSFEYEQTAELAQEMAVAAEMVKAETAWHRETLDAYTALDQFYKDYFYATTGMEYARATAEFNDGRRLRILDMGAGRGETSLYLASFGHDVFAVEPSRDFCEVIEYVGTKFNREVTIYNCSAEHLDTEGDYFDVVIFNASLHHCDDPVAALKNAYRLLRNKGKLIVANEPLISGFKSRAQWEKELQTSPEEFGHYGGNEHCYHLSEYVSMIKLAGFRDVRAEVVARLRSREAIARDKAVDPHRSGLRNLAKEIYSQGMCFMVAARLRPGIALMQKLSLAQSTYSATK